MWKNGDVCSFNISNINSFCSISCKQLQGKFIITSYIYKDYSQVLSESTNSMFTLTVGNYTPLPPAERSARGHCRLRVPLSALSVSSRLHSQLQLIIYSNQISPLIEHEDLKLFQRELVLVLNVCKNIIENNVTLRFAPSIYF